MRQNTIAGIVLSCLFALVLIVFFGPFKFISKEVIILLLSILQVISLFFVFFSDTSRSENFFFEVSPERKKCLLEQVSLTGRSRGCECCQKGTVGGYPPLYREWLQPEGENELWKRTDNWTTNPYANVYQSQLPPTELVD